MYLNRATIIGNLTRDPELKALPAGSSVASFGVATNRTWKDQNGEKKEASEFHNIVVFGRQADTCAQYLKKGQQVLVEGRLQTRSWDKDGVKQYRTEIVADRVQFGAKTGGAPSHEARGDGAPIPPHSAPAHRDTDYAAEDNISPDDIPF